MTSVNTEWRAFMLREAENHNKLHMAFDWTAESIEAFLRAELPSYVQDALTNALRNDATEGTILKLFSQLPVRWQFVVVLLLYKRRPQRSTAAQAAYRGALEHHWTMHHEWLLQVMHAKGRPLLERMFEAARQWPLGVPPARGSSEDPIWLTVYRGTSHQSPAMAARGLSWTRSREVACFFATTYSRCGDKPVVLVARRSHWSHFCLYTNERAEEELVCFKGAKLRWQVDPGGPEEWRAVGEAYGKRAHSASLSLAA